MLRKTVFAFALVLSSTAFSSDLTVFKRNVEFEKGNDVLCKQRMVETCEADMNRLRSYTAKLGLVANRPLRAVISEDKYFDYGDFIRCKAICSIIDSGF